MKLKELIGEELFKQLPEDKRKEYKDKDLINNDGSFIPKDRFDQINEEKKEYKKQIAERDTQLTDLKSKVKDSAELTNKISELEKLNEETKTNYEEKIKKDKFDRIVTEKLREAKAKNIKALEGVIDWSKVKQDGDNIIGLEEQLAHWKKEADYLFDKPITGTGSFGTGDNGQGGKSKEISLGEKLAKERASQMKASEELNNFFK